mmetsp:Transcript_28296/g.64096  ORF Transcript_28296/g.64096 Transcript_28296/m.64096 type:complete len:330 (+) Transcript_28296:1421-2410(+)
MAPAVLGQLAQALSPFNIHMITIRVRVVLGPPPVDFIFDDGSFHSMGQILLVPLLVPGSNMFPVDDILRQSLQLMHRKVLHRWVHANIAQFILDRVDFEEAVEAWRDSSDEDSDVVTLDLLHQHDERIKGCGVHDVHLFKVEHQGSEHSSAYRSFELTAQDILERGGGGKIEIPLHAHDKDVSSLEVRRDHLARHGVPPSVDAWDACGSGEVDEDEIVAEDSHLRTSRLEEHLSSTESDGHVDAKLERGKGSEDESDEEEGELLLRGLPQEEGLRRVDQANGGHDDDGSEDVERHELEEVGEEEQGEHDDKPGDEVAHGTLRPVGSIGR